LSSFFNLYLIFTSKISKFSFQVTVIVAIAHFVSLEIAWSTILYTQGTSTLNSTIVAQPAGITVVCILF
jgi:hypothetical protein